MSTFFRSLKLVEVLIVVLVGVGMAASFSQASPSGTIAMSDIHVVDWS